MRIAIFSDPHLGYARFEEDSYVQAERVIVDASEKADIILCAGDLFDVKIPKLETLKKAVEIFKKAKVPVFMIHGNHERRSKDLVNPAQLVASSTEVRLLHGTSEVLEKDGEKVQILGIGSVPEEYSQEAVKKVMETYKKAEGAFTIIMLHQSIKELMPNGKDELSLEYLETLPFDIIINGHIHERIIKLDGRFIIPGSTVITQLKEDETAPKGYYLYDTKIRNGDFVPVKTRKFFYEKLEFADANEEQVKTSIRELVSGLRRDNPDALIAIKVDGKMKDGLSASDIRLEGDENVFIDNRLDSSSLSAKLEKIKGSREATLSSRELALQQLKEKLAGKVTLFDVSEFFEKLVEDGENALEYLEKHNKSNGTR